MTYMVNEMFFSLQGEGVRAGTANVFVRFAKCNLRCAVAPSAISPGGWVCDTDFDAYVDMDADRILADATALVGGAEALEAHRPRQLGVIFTGGEPALQLDKDLVRRFKEAGFFTAIETNGTRDVADLGLDWICLSPKVPEDKLKVDMAHEVKYVVTENSDIPATSVRAMHFLLSPAFSEDGTLPEANLRRAIQLVKDNPKWRLSCQQHKGWQIR